MSVTKRFEPRYSMLHSCDLSATPNRNGAAMDVEGSRRRHLSRSALRAGPNYRWSRSPWEATRNIRLLQSGHLIDRYGQTLRRRLLCLVVSRGHLIDLHV